MGEVVSTMVVLGKEVDDAMTAVEAQQQRLTLQRLIAMVCSNSQVVKFAYF
jgi:endophilin-A